MSDRMFMRRMPFPDADPVPVREAAEAAIAALRLAWQADRRGLMVLVGLNAGTVAAEIGQLLLSGRAVDAVVDGDRRTSPTARLLAVGALGLAAAAGNGVRSAAGGTVSQAVQRGAEGRI
ncbi:MAG TPA: hypothetical protein VHF91_09850, partial [Acidimicrobiales bacterium]|nr:hypothetical protein [Acidimicrobiales bacterium]